MMQVQVYRQQSYRRKANNAYDGGQFTIRVIYYTTNFLNVSMIYMLSDDVNFTIKFKVNLGATQIITIIPKMSFYFRN